MALSIIWSEFAETQLDEIYEYYKNRVSVRVAEKLVVGIINESKKLIKAPFVGEEEELLKNRAVQYRYLIYKSYKLIYSVDLDNGYIKIADVFDTRQNPPKMNRTK